MASSWIEKEKVQPSLVRRKEFLDKLCDLIFNKLFFYFSRKSVLLYCPAIFCLLVACSLATVASTNENYPYVHSGWHALISIALLFLVLRCYGKRRRSNSVAALSDPIESSASGCTSTIGNDSVSQSPSINTSERSTTYLQMPHLNGPSQNSSEAGQNQNSSNSILNKLSYLQSFRSLMMSRQDW